MKALVLFNAGLLLAAALSHTATAATVVATPASSLLNSGASFELVLRGQDFAENVIGGGLSLAWNPGVLNLVSVSIDTTTWSFASGPGVHDPLAGTLSDLYFATFSAVLPTGNFAIASLQFVAAGVGSTSIQMTASGTQPFASDLAQVIPVNFVDASVLVSAVPEPATWALFGLATVLLPWLNRRRLAAGPVQSW